MLLEQFQNVKSISLSHDPTLLAWSRHFNKKWRG